MQDYNPIQPTALISQSRATINNNMDSLASHFSGSCFPTNNLQAGMYCWRTDLKQMYQLAEDLVNWNLINDLSQGYNSVAHANRADYAIKDKNGNDIAETYSKQAETNKIVLSCYPVGSIYMSVNSTDPAILFGGTWQQLAGGRVLIGQDSSHQAGSTGGSETQNITLAAANLPAHKHDVGVSLEAVGGHTHTRGSMEISGTMLGGGNLGNNPQYFTGAFARTGTGPSKTRGADADGENYSNAANFYASRSWSGATSSSGGHNHTVSVSENNVGSGSAFNVSHMQPYLAVYMWKRVA